VYRRRARQIGANLHTTRPATRIRIQQSLHAASTRFLSCSWTRAVCARSRFRDLAIGTINKRSYRTTRGRIGFFCDCRPQILLTQQRDGIDGRMDQAKSSGKKPSGVRQSQKHTTTYTAGDGIGCPVLGWVVGRCRCVSDGGRSYKGVWI